MKRDAIIVAVLAVLAGRGLAQSPYSSNGRDWHSGPPPKQTNIVRTSFRNGPSWGSPDSPYGSCGTCGGTDRTCMRKLIEFATYRPQFSADDKKLPTPYTPSLLAWFPNGSCYCTGDCGTHAACRDKKMMRGASAGMCYGPACSMHSTLAERPAMPEARSYSSYREGQPRMKQPGSYHTEEPPLRRPNTTARPAASLTMPVGYRVQPSSDLLPARR